MTRGGGPRGRSEASRAERSVACSRSSAFDGIRCPVDVPVNLRQGKGARLDQTRAHSGHPAGSSLRRRASGVSFILPSEILPLEGARSLSHPYHPASPPVAFQTLQIRSVPPPSPVIRSPLPSRFLTGGVRSHPSWGGGGEGWVEVPVSIDFSFGSRRLVHFHRFTGRVQARPTACNRSESTEKDGHPHRLHPRDTQERLLGTSDGRQGACRGQTRSRSQGGRFLRARASGASR